MNDKGWNERLLMVIQHLPYSMEIKLSVINHDSREVFESKGGNETIYYEIKGPINAYCESLLRDFAY